MKVSIYTLGCKVNQYESNGILQKFKEKGYEIVPFEEYADIYIVNTCTVTNESDRKCRQVIRKAKQQNENAVLIVVGCYANVAKKELEKISGIDIILDNTEKAYILNYLEDHIEKENNKIEYTEYGDITYIEKTRAMIKVQDGCDRFCTYCIIPYARGRVRSRKLENAISEINKIAKNGIKEVVITGIHLASYKDENYELIDLLEEINKIDGIERIRLGSLEPKLITLEFIQRLSELEKICDQFHLSLQSGSDSVLRRMNRRYTTQEFFESVEIIKKYYPNVNLTTDIIVGFPGETEEEFNETYKFIEKINFFMIHVFRYSPKKGTKAAIMENQITNAIKEERSNKLISLSKEVQKNILNLYINKEIEVLFEETNNGYTKGHTNNYIVVNIKENKEVENLIKRVKILAEENNELIGKLV